MTSNVRILASVLALATLSAGCDMGLQEKLDAKQTERFEAAKEVVRAIEASRSAQLAGSLPAEDAKFEGSEHPMITWRKQIIARADSKNLMDLASNAKPTEGMKVGAMGTPSQLSAEMGATFAKEAGEYWNDTSSLSRYVGFIKGFFADIEDARKEAVEAAAEAEQAAAEGKAEEARHLRVKAVFVDPPFIDEARFDQIFVHAARFYSLTKLKSRAQVLHRALADWEIAFDFPAKGRENFSAYVTRICFAHPTLREHCKDVPHEFRAAVIDRPYLQWLKTSADGYKVTIPTNKVFADVMARFSKTLDAALAVEPPHTEEPVLPGTFAAAGGISGMRTIFSKKNGVFLAGKRIADTFSGLLPSSYAAVAAEAIETLKNTPGNRVNYQRAVLEAPGDIGLGVIRDIIRAYPLGVVKHVALVGRRRIDESMRRASMALKLPHQDTAKTFSYQFTGDPSKTSCDLMGFMGEALLGKKKEFYLEIGPKRIRAAAVSYNKETKEWSVGQTIDLGSPSDPSKLEEWLSKNEGEIQLFLNESFTYDEASKQISALLFKCVDDQVPTGDPKKPMLTRKCGKSEARDNTIVLGICK